MKNITTELELLAPARDAETAFEAIRHGADAVYIGAPAFGARAAATNSLDDIKRVVDFAHQFNARVYVTLNVIIYDHELEQAARLVQQLYDIGVDALIVQDMGLLRMQLPPIPLHASTQCDTRTPEKARFLEDAGMSQIVLARELSLDEIRDIRRATTVPLEGFVHGALCVSYSGDCHAGALTMGRSANRGECPQICRLRYRLTDDKGQPVAQDGHWLSMRDMRRIDSLEQMAEAGISSFKIEGRLKDAAYVKNVVSAYSRELDRIVGAHPERYRRASAGRVRYGFAPDIDKAFNRGFTSYFLTGTAAAGRMASALTPKWLGQAIGTVARGAASRRPTNRLRVQLADGVTVANGDGIVWFDADNKLQGARINRAEGDMLNLAETVTVAPGTTLYRNNDRAAAAQVAGKTAERLIALQAVLERTPGAETDDGADLLVLTVSDCRGNTASVSEAWTPEGAAKTPQLEARLRTMGRLGGSIYELKSLDDRLGDDYFVPASLLTRMRREALDRLDAMQAARPRTDLRRAERRDVPYVTDAVDYHTNVANRLARQFYRDHGVREIADAIEVAGAPEGETVVMNTRYCVRRELGQCLKRGGRGGDWMLHACDYPDMKLRLHFDCRRCGMCVTIQN